MAERENALPHFSTNEHSEVIDALEVATVALVQVWNEPHRWKWVAIGLTMAVQGLLVTALDQGNDVVVQREKDIRAFEDWLERRSGPLPGGRLADFWELFGRVFPVEPEGTDELKHLYLMRNRFVHFLPAQHAEIVLGLPRCCIATCSIMATLLDRGHWFEVAEKARAETLIAGIRLQAEALQRHDAARSVEDAGDERRR
jgi:hypothetical protein